MVRVGETRPSAGMYRERQRSPLFTWEFDFLIGWDAIKHYQLRIDPSNGALTGIDYDGNHFTTMSQFQYTSGSAESTIPTYATKCPTI
jgi:hypothetical protein